MSIALEARTRLNECHVERALAEVEGLGENATYLADLEREIEHWQIAYVAAAVTEIASLRAELSGPQLG